MDIRDFTRWSDTREPEMVVGMLNQFYELSEHIIQKGGGQKPHFIGDAVMTWFSSPEDAIRVAQSLRDEGCNLLQVYGLDLGIGLHIGEVVEGLLGSSTTRKL